MSGPLGGPLRLVCLAGEVMLAQLAEFRRLTRYGWSPKRVAYVGLVSVVGSRTVKSIVVS